MGFFTKKKTYVSSTAVNLAGDPKDAPSFRNTTLLNANLVFNDIPRGIVSGYSNSIFFKLRNYAKWANTSGYNNLIQISKANFVTGYSNRSIIAEQIKTLESGINNNDTVKIINSDYGPVNMDHWVQDYYLDHLISLGKEPEEILRELDSNPIEYDYDEVSDTITILEQTGSWATFSLPPSFDYTSNYVYAFYQIVKTIQDPNETTEGSWVSVGNFSYIDLVNYDQIYNNNSSQNINYTEVSKKIYSATDGGPNINDTIINTNKTLNYQEIDSIYKKDEYMGNAPDGSLLTIKHTKTIKSNYTLRDVVTAQTTEEYINGYFYLVTTTITSKELDVTYEYKDKEEYLREDKPSKLGYLIYKIGSGNTTLDNIFTNIGESSAEWAPPIFIRTDKQWTSSAYPSLAEPSEKAIKRALGWSASMKSIKDDLVDHESFDDMHYVHILFGVSVNTPNSQGLGYVYQFLDYLRMNSTGSVQTRAQYDQLLAEHNQSVADYKAWKESQNFQYGSSPGSKPTILPAPIVPKNSFRFDSSKSGLNFRSTYYWNFLEKNSGSGRKLNKLTGKLAKPEEFWWSKEGDFSNVFSTYWNDGVEYNNEFYTPNFINWVNEKVYTLFRQVTLNTWESITVTGFKYYDLIHRGTSNDITLHDAITGSGLDLNPNEDVPESSFIVPMHMNILENMGIIKGSELQNSSTYMIIGSYKVVKQLRGFVKFLMVAAVVIGAWYFGAFSLGGATGGSGLLGTNLAVGIGLIGGVGSIAIAAIVGAVVNQLAAIILVMVLTKIATKLLGKKLGMLVALITSFIVPNMGKITNINIGGAFSKIFDINNLMKIVLDTFRGISKYLQSLTADLSEQMKELVNAYKAEEERMKEIIGDYNVDNLLINPMLLTEATFNYTETPSMFLDRTLYTGMDLAEITINSISEFTEQSLRLDSNI